MPAAVVFVFPDPPPDLTDRLGALGLRVDARGDNATLSERALQVSHAPDLPAEAVARALGCGRYWRSRAAVRPRGAGGDLDLELTRVEVGPAGAREHELAAVEEELEEDDVRGEPEALAQARAEEALEGRVDAGERRRTFGLRVPRGWRAPDPFAGIAPGRPVARWSSGVGAVTLGEGTLRWLAARLRAADRLDDGPAPDLSRWERRLAARHADRSSPGWAADWERLTRADRALSRPGRVMGWKLAGEPAVLVPAEVALVAAALGDVPPGLAAEVGALAPMLAGEVEVGRPPGG